MDGGWDQCAELRKIDVKKLYSGVARCRATLHGATVKKWPPLTPPLHQRDDSLTADTTSDFTLGCSTLPIVKSKPFSLSHHLHRWVRKESPPTKLPLHAVLSGSQSATYLTWENTNNNIRPTTNVHKPCQGGDYLGSGRLKLKYMHLGN